VVEILNRYYSHDEIAILEKTILKENLISDEYIRVNKSLSEYFAKVDTRLTKV
jgi:hypothetical protein